MFRNEVEDGMGFAGLVQSREERKQERELEGVDIDELLKQAKGLCLRINAEGGHGSVVHDMAKRVLEIIGDSSR